MQISSLYEKITITHIILISLILHVFVIAQPQNLQIWDESIFLELVRNFLNGEDHTPYQLPGLNFFVGSTITIFGDYWFSWRIPSIIFGMLVLLVFYKILCNVTSERNALLATSILSFDTIFFVHSTLFLRDMPLIFFGLLAIFLYMKKQYYLSALPLGFAFLIKETAIFFLIFITIYHIGLTKPWLGKIKYIKTTIIFLGIVASTFLLPLWVYDTIYKPIIYDPVIPTYETVDGKNIPINYPRIKVMESRNYTIQEPVGFITNPIEHLEIFFSGGYITSDAYKVKNWDTRHTNFPWSWVLPLPLPKDANGLGWVNEKLIDETKEGVFTKGKIVGIEWRGDPNLSLWVIGFWGSLAFIFSSIVKKAWNKTTLFLVSGIASMYLPYLLLSLTGRVMFPYYFLLTVPFVALGIVLLLDLIKNNNARMISKAVLLSGIMAWFVWFYPLKII